MINMAIAGPTGDLDRDQLEGRFDVEVMIQGQAKILSVHVSKNDLYLCMDEILLDFWNVDVMTAASFMHMFTSATKEVDVDEKLRRMNAWAAAIGGYDSIMVGEAGRVYDRATLMEMLRNGRIPRPQNIILRAIGNQGLIKLFKSLHFSPHKGSEDVFIVPWVSSIWRIHE